MVIEENYKRLLDELSLHESADVTLAGTPVSLRLLDHGSKLSLASLVYEGGNYIPQSVRRCLTQRAPFRPTAIRTSLKVDEEHFSISLNYLGQLDHFNGHTFRGVMEEFIWLTEEWKLFLDEHDKNDLVHVRVQ